MKLQEEAENVFEEDSEAQVEAVEAVLVVTFLKESINMLTVGRRNIAKDNTQVFWVDEEKEQLK